MNTIYSVSQGEYSGYQVLALFAAKDDAEKFCATLNEDAGPYNQAFVEEFSYYPEGQQPERRVWYSTTGYGDPRREVGWDFSDATEWTDPGPWAHRRTEAEAIKAGQDMAARRAAEKAGQA